LRIPGDHETRNQLAKSGDLAHLLKIAVGVVDSGSLLLLSS
jgi:hypothetical protein